MREKNILLYTLLVPALLYPLLVWLTMTVTSFLVGQSESTPARVAILALPEEHRGLEVSIRKTPLLDLKELANPEQQLAERNLDALLAWRGDKLELLYDGASASGMQAMERLSRVVRNYRDNRLDEMAKERGLTPQQLQLFWFESKNVATSGDIGRYLLGVLLPFTLIVILSLGGMYPAIDATAGERERNTWETSLTLATSRVNVVIAKYLYVSTMSSCAGLLNLAAMTISLRAIVAPMSQELADTMSLTLSPASFLIVTLGTTFLAFFMSAAMMLVASFARTFREGQSLVTPLFLLMLLPVSLVMDRTLEFDTSSALIPVVNVALMWREAIRGNLPGQLCAITLLSSLVCIGVCIATAHYFMSRGEAALQGPQLRWFRKNR